MIMNVDGGFIVISRAHTRTYVHRTSTYIHASHARTLSHKQLVEGTS